MAQLKIVGSQETVDKFKRIVLAKHGKLSMIAMRLLFGPWCFHQGTEAV
ncbi:MAG: hypothetical protein ACRECH_16945 [Nitrososphaerales archaeon]